MIVYNETKTKRLELDDIDYTRGYLDSSVLLCENEDGEEELVEVQTYIEYTEKELNQIKIQELRDKLTSTDYKAIKYAEGWYTDEEYAPIKAQRETIREQIRELEKL